MSGSVQSDSLKRLVFLHWLPLELYPPAFNLARHLAAAGDWEIDLFTTENHLERVSLQISGVTIHRFASPSTREGVRRLLAYGAFHAAALQHIIRHRPDAVVYVEPQSAFPVYVASLLLPRLRVFIHHHEYHDPEQFHRPGMRLARFFHWLERKRLFKRARWISHTNEQRLARFLQDCPEAAGPQARVMGNFPPASWSSEGNLAWDASDDTPLKLVYVGSLSLTDTYIEEIVAWVKAQEPSTVTLDIYAYNVEPATGEFLREHATGAIRFHPTGLDYDELPGLLHRFHTGLLLYRATTTNYRYNASNKLFEYLACGLDVVYPDRMQGVKPYASVERSPRVIEQDFTRLTELRLEDLKHRPKVAERRKNHSCGEEFASLDAELRKVCESPSGDAPENDKAGD